MPVLRAEWTVIDHSEGGNPITVSMSMEVPPEAGQWTEGDAYAFGAKHKRHFHDAFCQEDQDLEDFDNLRAWIEPDHPTV